MRPPLYRRQVAADLERWVAAGIIQPAQRDAALADLATEKGRPVADWLGLLGAIMVGAGAITFVAANWENMAKIVRLAILIAALAGTYWASDRFFALGRERMGQAFVLLGVALFGASIMLIGQTYHFNADFPDGIRLWAIGALAAAVLVPSRTALGAALAIALVWSHVQTMNAVDSTYIHWGFLVFLVAAGPVAYALRWGTGGHVLTLALFYWIALSAPGFEDRFGLPLDPFVYSLIALNIAGIGLALTGADRTARTGRIIGIYGLTLFLALSSIDYFRWLHGDPGMVVAAAPVLLLIGTGLLVAGAGRLAGGLSVPEALGVAGLLSAHLLLGWLLPGGGAIAGIALFWVSVVLVLTFGTKREWPAVINLSLIAFSAGLIATYFWIFDSLLTTAILFGLSGALFIGLSMLVPSVGRRFGRGAGQSPKSPKSNWSGGSGESGDADQGGRS